jgi:hypothetical protein
MEIYKNRLKTKMEENNFSTSLQDKKFFKNSKEKIVM